MKTYNDPETMPGVKKKKNSSSATGEVRILLVEEHDIFREGLTMFIDREPGLSVCGAVERAEETKTHIKETQPDIVILDISNIGMSGMEIIKSIRKEFREIPILVLSMYEGSYLTSLLKAAGADCCLDSLKVPDRLVEKIKGLVVK